MSSPSDFSLTDRELTNSTQIPVESTKTNRTPTPIPPSTQSTLQPAPNMNDISIPPVSPAKVVTVGEGSTIPTLDWNDWIIDIKANQKRFIDGIEKACKEVGFFALVNVPIKPETVKNAYDAMEKTFALSQEEKEKYMRPDTGYQRGYIPLYQEKAKGVEEVGDLKEYLHIGPELDEAKRESLGYAPNVFPEEVNLKDPMIQLRNEMYEVMLEVADAVSLAAAIEKTHIRDLTSGGENLLRGIHYPALSKDAKPGAVWAAAHTDIDMLTGLVKAEEDGLEVLTSSGEWVRVKTPDHALIINVGDMLQNMTNGLFKSAVHRVLSTETQQSAGTGRYSIVEFFHPKSADQCGPLDACVQATGGVIKYPNATRWILLIERLADLGQANKEMLKELADSGLTEQRMAICRDLESKGVEIPSSCRPSVDAMRAMVRAGVATPAVQAELNERENRT